MAEDSAAQLTTFSCPECYVYAPLPPATSYGHRAELWDVEKWLKAVRLRVVTAGDDATVQLEDPENGELYAECPLPNDGTSLTTAVEPVVDSSRYFVVRLVDRAAPRKHAFIGLGFRTRGDASDFTAALDDYRQYLRRKAAAEAMRAEYEAAEPSAEEGGTGSSSAAGPSLDLSLKPGQKITLKLSGSGKRSTGQGDAGSGPSSSDSAGGGSSSSSFAARLSASGGGLLPPPPPAGGGLLRPPPPPPSSFVATGSSDTAAAATAAAMRQLRVSGSNSDHVPASQPGARPAAAAATDAGDDWAKFDD